MTTIEIGYRVREARGEPQGALVLLHGRGADENDLFPLLDALDPDRRLVGVTPRGPLSLPPGGAHWYVLGQLGYPDPDTFLPTFDKLAEWLDTFLEERDIAVAKTILGGFSQGSVMSYALALGPEREPPAALVPFSGFIPTVEGFDLDVNRAGSLPVFIGHGTYDPIIPVDFGREARDRLEAAGAKVAYREYPLPHAVDPGWVDEVARSLDGLI